MSWVREHLTPRLRALVNLVLQVDVLLETRDPARWFVAWMLYLGIVGATLTAIITGATRGVIYVANTVLRPHALPIITPELERYFISWPQLAIGMGYHAHIITALYFAAPAYTAAIVGALLGDEFLKRILLPHGATGRDIADHTLLILTFITAWMASLLGPQLREAGALAPGLQALAPHIAVASVWLVYSLTAKGLAYRTVGTAIALVSKIIFNTIPEPMKDLQKIYPIAPRATR